MAYIGLHVVEMLIYIKKCVSCGAISVINDYKLGYRIPHDTHIYIIYVYNITHRLDLYM